jgi:hypothetical protein
LNASHSRMGLLCAANAPVQNGTETVPARINCYRRQQARIPE